MSIAQRLDDNPCRPRHFRPASCAPVTPDGPATHSLEVCRTRLLVTGAMFALLFAVIALRLADVVLLPAGAAEARLKPRAAAAQQIARADIVDRNGRLLATTLDAPSLYVEPKKLQAAGVNPAEAAREVARVLPGLDPIKLQADMSSRRGFVYIKRLLTPGQAFDVNRLGIPGLDFEHAERRFYPLSDLAAHAVGYCDIDNKGLDGIEHALDGTLKNRTEQVQLSIDARVQFIVHEELQHVIDQFSAKGAAGIVMDVHTGEIVAMVSLPDFDPNHPAAHARDDTLDEAKQRDINKITLGDYELGSVFKIFNTAMALDTGVATMTSMYDAIHPIHVGRFTIEDYHGKHRMLSLPEILMYSSNLGSARMAMAAGAERQQEFLGRMGLLQPAKVELDEVATPHYPKTWREVNVMTIAFGHGISVSPLSAVTGVAAVVNGGLWHQATMLKVPPGTEPEGRRVISEKTSDRLRKLMRLVVQHGTATFAAAPGYVVGGKTGTAEKAMGGHYAEKKLLDSFISAFPMNDPKYVMLMMVDEPHGTKETHGYATAGWTVAPATGRIIQRIAPILGVQPVDENSPEIVRALAVESLQGKKIEDY